MNTQIIEKVLGKDFDSKTRIWKFLNTDFYQITMGFAYVVLEKNKEKTAFEGFVRHIKTAVNENDDFYIFDGEDEIIEFMEAIREELNSPEISEAFIALVESKITAENKDELIEIFRKNWKNVDKDFEYSVVPNGTIVLPYVPVFQFYGDKMIGQMIETPVTNIYNGKTGLATLAYLNNTSIEEMEYITGVVNGDIQTLRIYSNKLRERAQDFIQNTEVPLMEAAFRRAPSAIASSLASLIAIENGWFGTSNVMAYQEGLIKIDKIGGSMAHAFIMSYNVERQAIIDYCQIFPGTTVLIDTYDVIRCLKMIIELVREGLIQKPRMVRVDSDPLEMYLAEIREILEDEDLDIGVFISGDMTPERLQELEGYSASMAGTKFVYMDEIISKVNCGFVYKIVQFEVETENGIERFYPEKKAEGKSNYSGLKYMDYIDETNELIVDCSGTRMGYNGIDFVNENTEVKFITERN